VTVRFVFGSVALYLALTAFLWLGQARLIIEPERKLAVHASELAFPVKDVRIPVAGGGTIDAWWIAPASVQGKLFIYFHGNATNLASSVDDTALLRSLGHGILMPEYRGFGESDGPFPSEARMYEDAEAALAFAIESLGYAPNDIYVYGHSLGSAVAIDLASKHPELAGLVAESAFTSIADMARLDRRYAMLPVGLLLNQRFESARKVAGLDVPVLFIHGTEDEVVPFTMAEALYARSRGRKHLLAIEGGRHDDDRIVAPAAMRAALNDLVHGGG